MSREERQRLTGGKVVYKRVAEIVRGWIEQGLYAPGDFLPSEAAMRDEFLVARNSLRRGLDLLEKEGLIETIPSKGRIVRGRVGGAASHYRYQRIADDLRAEIIKGALVKLPGELTLKRKYGASRNTVRQALALLEQEGLVRAEQGKGRFVLPK